MERFTYEREDDAHYIVYDRRVFFCATDERSFAERIVNAMNAQEAGHANG